MDTQTKALSKSLNDKIIPHFIINDLQLKNKNVVIKAGENGATNLTGHGTNIILTTQAI